MKSKAWDELSPCMFDYFLEAFDDMILIYTYYLPSVRPRGPNKKTRRATNNHREGFPILALEGREQLGNLEFFL